MNQVLNSAAADEEGSSFRQALEKYSKKTSPKSVKSRRGGGDWGSQGDGAGDGGDPQRAVSCSDAEVSRIKDTYVQQGMDPLTSQLEAEQYVKSTNTCERAESSIHGAPAPTPDPSCSKAMVIYGLMQKGTGKAVAKFIADGGWKSAVEAKGGGRSDYCNPVPTMKPTAAPTSCPTSRPTVAATTAGLAMPFQSGARMAQAGSSNSQQPPAQQQQHQQQQQMQVLPFAILGCTGIAYLWIGLTRFCAKPKDGTKTGGNQSNDDSAYQPRGSAMVDLYDDDDGEGERSTYQSQSASQYQNQYV
jgi:hypothetical protein